jgi:hypothetical protein
MTETASTGVVLTPDHWDVATSAGTHLGGVSFLIWRKPGLQWMATWTPPGASVAVTSDHATQDEAVAAVIAGRADTRCAGDASTRPYWMGVDQYDPCRCDLAAGHSGVHGCEHTRAKAEAAAVRS